MSRPALLAGPIALFYATPALASGSLVVDNASIVGYDTYQVESWLMVQGHGWQFWQLPAVQPVHNLEVTIGANEAQLEDGSYGQGLVIQAKGLFRPLEKNSWGVGLTSGTILSLDAESHGVASTAYINVPLSFSFKDDRYVLHLNAGWAFDPAQAQPHAATWGVGGEYNPWDHLGLVGEVFGSTRYSPGFQAGFRSWPVPDHFDLMATAGNDASGWRYTVGIGYYQ